MSYQKMTTDEVHAFLTESPPRTAKLATVRPDGRAHVAPVWFALDGEDIVWLTGDFTVKGRNLLRTGRASLCVDDDRPPFSFVSVEGPVTVDTDPAAVLHWCTLIGGRYMGAELAEQYGRRNAVPGEIVFRLRPESVASARDVAH